MKILMKGLLLFILMIFTFEGNTAITNYSYNGILQDSAILVIKNQEGVDHIKYAYKKGDKLVYKDEIGKHKAEIIGFDGDKVITKDFKKGIITSIDISKIESIRKYDENEKKWNISLCRR